MKITFGAPFLLAMSVTAPTFAATYYAASDGSGDGTSDASPSSVSTAVNNAQPGDTVYFREGTYTGWGGSIHPARSGTADAWITFEAYPGELPIFEGSGVGSGTYEYIRYVGLVARGGSSGGFGNGWTDGACATMSNGNLEYINCIADENGINGIAHYCAPGLHIKQSIVAHNGNKDPSWSSGVNLFAVQGGPTSNVVEQTISFENLDISTNHSDGSGFIADQNGAGATFINNIGFRNGGSCIRITNSTNSQIINNTCFHNGQDAAAKYHDEIFFSDTSKTHEGALLRNNLCIPTSGQSGLTMGSGVTTENDQFSGTDSLVVSAAGALDLHLVAGSSAIDAGASGSPSPTEDIGFDWKCIKEQSGQAVSWWAYAIDYEYIAQIGGVAACFQAGTRTASPDQGAYEYGAAVSSGGSASGGASGESGGSSSVGTGGASDAAGGALSAGGNLGAGGTDATGGASPANGGAPLSAGGSLGAGGTNATGGASLGAGGTSLGTGGAPLASGGSLGRGGASATGGAPQGSGGSLGAGGAPLGNGGAPLGNGGMANGSGGLLASGSGGTLAEAGGSTVPATSAASSTTKEDSGCACAMNRRGPASGWLASSLGLLLVAARRRGDRKAKSERAG
jgi:hypothetical protein